QEDSANQRNRDRDYRYDYGTHGAQEEEDHDDDDEKSLSECPEYFVYGILNVLGRIVRNAHLHSCGYLSFNIRQHFADFTNHLERVCGGQHPNTHKRGGFTVEAHVLLIVLGSQLNVCDLTKPNNDAALVLYDELTKLLSRAQIRVGDQIHGHHGSL